MLAPLPVRHWIIRPAQSLGRRPKDTTPSRALQRKGARREARPTYPEYGTLRVEIGLAEMLQDGVIMDVVHAEQAHRGGGWRVREEDVPSVTFSAQDVEA